MHDDSMNFAKSMSIPLTNADELGGRYHNFEIAIIGAVRRSSDVAFLAFAGGELPDCFAYAEELERLNYRSQMYALRLASNKRLIAKLEMLSYQNDVFIEMYWNLNAEAFIIAFCRTLREMGLASLPQWVVDEVGQTPPETTRQAPVGADQLTERELEVAHMLANGLTQRKIARTLILSPHTIKTFTRAIAEKLKIKGTRERYAIRLQQMGYGTGDKK